MEIFDRSAISGEDIKALLAANFNIMRRDGVELNVRINRALGQEAPEENSRAVRLIEKMNEELAGIIASRLKGNNRCLPLISSLDYEMFTSRMLDIIEADQDEEEKLNDEMRQIFCNGMESMFNGVKTMLENNNASEKDPYEEYWRYIEAIYSIAQTHQVRPIEVQTTRSLADELIRKTTPKSERIAAMEKMFQTAYNAEVLAKAIIDPMVAAFAGGDQELLKELRAELEEEVMPKLTEYLGRAKVVAETWISEQNARIYSEVSVA